MHQNAFFIMILFEGLKKISVSKEAKDLLVYVVED
jgi:hypothetical protein